MDHLRRFLRVLWEIIWPYDPLAVEKQSLQAHCLATLLLALRPFRPRRFASCTLVTYGLTSRAARNLMRRVCIIILSLLVLASTCAPANDHPLELVIVDKSEAGTPLEVSGKVLLTRTMGKVLLGSGSEADQAWVSWQQRIVARNISGKSILMMAAEVNVTINGNTLTYPFTMDGFFEEQHGTEPQGWLDMPEGSPGFLDVGELDKSLDQRAEFRVIFVQFEDGTDFGDRAAVAADLARRNTLLAGLRRLAETYSVQGEQAFKTQLEEKDPDGNLPFPGTLRVAKEKGLRAAFERVQSFVATAEAHEKKFQSNRTQ